VFIVYKPTLRDEFINIRSKNISIAMSNPTVDSNDSLKSINNERTYPFLKLSAREIGTAFGNNTRKSQTRRRMHSIISRKNQQLTSLLPS
jgi:hypothetical protein